MRNVGFCPTTVSSRICLAGALGASNRVHMYRHTHIARWPSHCDNIIVCGILVQTEALPKCYQANQTKHGIKDLSGPENGKKLHSMDSPHAACDVLTDGILLLLFHTPKLHTANITHIDNAGALSSCCALWSRQARCTQPWSWQAPLKVKKLLRQSTAYVLAATCVPKCES